jgi:hypothetical protein
LWTEPTDAELAELVQHVSATTASVA